MSSSPYAPAANILNQIFTKRKGLKTIAYNQNGELTCSKVTYAQCSHVLEQKTLLDKIVKELSAKTSVQVKNQGLLYVLLYELLMGPNKSIRGGGAVKRQLMAHHDMLQSTLQQLQPSKNDSPESSSPNMTIPRYVRINTLVADREAVLKEIKEKLGKAPIYIDPHVPDMLVVAPTAENRGLLQDLFTSHKVVLQDKSSCFSALCLLHGFDDNENDTNDQFDYLDACAAPGNKTSHLAALIHNQNKTTKTSNNSQTPIVHALDKAPDRYKLLKRRMGELVPDGSVHCYNLDFLDINSPKKNSLKQDNKKFEHVQAILLDPSCSGSGMTTNHTEHSLNRDPYHTNDRIQSLSDFQFQALRHATKNFPLVDRVIYSTCSRYYAENEGVVKRVLEATDSEWQLVAPKCLESWQRRGLMAADNGKGEEANSGLTAEQAKCLIRVDPDHDATNGFFVACLQRVNSKDNKKKKRKSSGWRSPSATPDTELYNNQFHAKESASKAVSVEPTSKKRKEHPDGKATDSSKEIPSGVSKKRAKKMEWKKQQRLKKEARLKRKQAQQNE